MTLEKINEKEKRQNAAFEKWISDNRQFFNLPKSQQMMLSDYVRALHAEIADLESELIRNKSARSDGRRIIHISQQAIRDNTNLGTNDPVIAVHDSDGAMTKYHEYTIADGIRIVYNQDGIDLDGSVIRVWIEVDE